MEDLKHKLEEYFHPEFVQNIKNLSVKISEDDLKLLFNSYSAMCSEGKYKFKTIVFTKSKDFSVEYIEIAENPKIIKTQVITNYDSKF